MVTKKGSEHVNEHGRGTESVSEDENEDANENENVNEHRPTNEHKTAHDTVNEETKKTKHFLLTSFFCLIRNDHGYPTRQAGAGR